MPPRAAGRGTSAAAAAPHTCVNYHCTIQLTCMRLPAAARSGSMLAQCGRNRASDGWRPISDSLAQHRHAQRGSDCWQATHRPARPPPMITTLWCSSVARNSAIASALQSVQCVVNASRFKCALSCSSAAPSHANCHAAACRGNVRLRSKQPILIKLNPSAGTAEHRFCTQASVRPANRVVHPICGMRAPLAGIKGCVPAATSQNNLWRSLLSQKPLAASAGTAARLINSLA